MVFRGPLPDRLKRLYIVDSETGCHVWHGQRDRLPGIVLGIGKPMGAHYAAFQDKYGVIPDGQRIDRTCHTRSCVNPEHYKLRPKGFCRHGHKLTPRNRYRPKKRKSQWVCRECSRISYAKHMASLAKRKAELLKWLETEFLEWQREKGAK